MNGLKTVIAFVLFFVGFFIAEIVRFERYIFAHDSSSILSLIVIAILSGFSLAVGLAALELFPKGMVQKVVFGGILGVLVFFLFFGIEDALSSKRLYSNPQAKSFSELRGHCGVYPGRALIQIYRWDWNPSLNGILNDFTLSNQCRVSRFRELIKRNQIDCRPEEELAQCLVRWMPIFAERGNWNADVRQMFLDEVSRPETKASREAWMEYALKDYELDVGRPSILKQAGLEEEFSDDYLYRKQLDEYQNVALTKTIFETAVSNVHPETATGPEESPLLVKFREAAKEVSFKTEKLPELEKELSELKKRLQL